MCYTRLCYGLKKISCTRLLCPRQHTHCLYKHAVRFTMLARFLDLRCVNTNQQLLFQRETHKTEHCSMRFADLQMHATVEEGIYTILAQILNAGHCKQTIHKITMSTLTLISIIQRKYSKPTRKHTPNTQNAYTQHKEAGSTPKHTCTLCPTNTYTHACTH